MVDCCFIRLHPVFDTYFSVQVSGSYPCHWRRPFGDMLQNVLQPDNDISAGDMFSLIAIFAQIALVWMVIYVITRFIVSHYIFRWRTAMNDFYMMQWKRVRHIEGASQRIQEDTMRFAGIMEGLGVSIIDAVMTLFRLCHFYSKCHNMWKPCQLWVQSHIRSLLWLFSGRYLVLAY